MTEEDTFKKLKKATFSDAYLLYMSFDKGYVDRRMQAALKEIGWTYEELEDEWISRSPATRVKLW